MHTLKPESIRISLREIFYIIFLKIHIAIGVFFIIVIFTNAYVFSLTPEYLTVGQILVKPFIDTRQEVFVRNSFKVDSPSEESMNTEKEILTSQELIEDVIKVLGLEPSPQKPPNLLIRMGLSSRSTPSQALIRYVKSGIKVKLVTNSQLIRVTKKGDDPEAITKILNAYLECYLSRHIQIHKSISGVIFYEKWLKKFEQELKDAKSELEKKVKQWNIIDIREQKTQNLVLLQILRRNLSEVKGELAKNKVIIQNITKKIDRDGNFAILPAILRNNALLAEFTRAYIPLFIQKGKIMNLYRKNSLERIGIEKQLGYFMNEIRGTQKKLLDGMVTDLQALEAKKKTFEQNIGNILLESQKIAEIEIEYNDWFVKVEQTRDTYKLYLNRLEQARMREQRDLSGVSNVSILGKPTVPSKPIGSNKKAMLFISIFIGGLAATGSAFAGYYLDHTVKRARDIEDITQLPVLSSLENIKARR